MLTQCKHQQTLSSLFSSAQPSWLQHPNRSSEWHTGSSLLAAICFKQLQLPTMHCMKYYSCRTWHLHRYLLSFLKNKVAATCHRSSFLHMKEADWRSINLLPVFSNTTIPISFQVLDSEVFYSPVFCSLCTARSPAPHRITDLMLPLLNQPYVFTAVSYCPELGIIVSSATTHTYNTLPTIFIPTFFLNYFSSIAGRELGETLSQFYF